MKHKCLHAPLSRMDTLQIIGDYFVAIAGVSYMAILYMHGIISDWVIHSTMIGFLLNCPTEYIFPRIGWVYYHKCITYKVMPVKTTYIIHSIWDAFILLEIVMIAAYLYGDDIFVKYNESAAFYMNVLGMLQEIILEVNQTLWYYPPNNINRVWARIGGRDMTLQQWRWGLLPALYYSIIIQLL